MPDTPPDAGLVGTVTHLNVSDGGVPKLPIPEVRIGTLGLDGDRQRDTNHHGGAERAVCVFSLEVIERLRAEGHPIAPGSTGENITIRGLDWPRVTPGSRLAFAGGVVLEVTNYTSPCSTIRESFIGIDSKRIRQDEHPGESRVYTRVLVEGGARAGESVVLHPA